VVIGVSRGGLQGFVAFGRRRVGMKAGWLKWMDA
jgi:hypothetical protein